MECSAQSQLLDVPQRLTLPSALMQCRLLHVLLLACLLSPLTTTRAQFHTQLSALPNIVNVPSLSQYSGGRHRGLRRQLRAMARGAPGSA